MQPEVLVGPPRRDAAARRALEKADLDEKRLVDVLDRVALLAERRGQAADADRPAAELLDDRQQQPAIDLVEPVLSTSSIFSARPRTSRVMRPSARTCA